MPQKRSAETLYHNQGIWLTILNITGIFFCCELHKKGQHRRRYLGPSAQVNW